MLHDEQSNSLPGEGQQSHDAHPSCALSRQSLIDQIKSQHRDHRFAIKQRSRLDRSLEAHIRVNVFGFSTFMDEKERKKISKQATDLITACRKNEQPEEYNLVAMLVVASDQSRGAWDAIESDREKALKKLVKQLPAYSFIEATKGAGALGFAQIIGEAGDLSNYANPGKLWKRLGLHVYKGHAMSTYRRETWRPRKLTSEEWIDNPFKPERYAIVAQIATWLVTAQVESKEKSGTKHGRPKSHYGEVYVRRREHTDITHPEWSDGHKRSDALRYTIKRFVRDLWTEWRRAKGDVETRTRLPVVDNSLQGDGNGHAAPETHRIDAVPDNSAQAGNAASVPVKPKFCLPHSEHPEQSGKRPARTLLKPTDGMPDATQSATAGNGATHAVKPTSGLPRSKAAVKAAERQAIRAMKPTKNVPDVHLSAEAAGEAIGIMNPIEALPRPSSKPARKAAKRPAKSAVKPNVALPDAPIPK